MLTAAECTQLPIFHLRKARVALAVFATRPADVLLLDGIAKLWFPPHSCLPVISPEDEPTNHLDGAAVASLCRGLREHGGVAPRQQSAMAFAALDACVPGPGGIPRPSLSGGLAGD